MEELISVVITTYRRSDMLEKAINSVYKQTYKNLEVIVVDDNCKYPEERKKTEEIIKKYNDIIYIKNKSNLGGALSRNEGIKKAKGELISFLDDDDEYLPERIEKMYRVYKKRKEDNIGLVYCKCFDVVDGKITKSFGKDATNNPLYHNMINCIAATSQLLVPKKVLEDVDMFSDAVCKQDSILIHKILVKKYRILFVDEELVLYNEHSGTRISGTSKKNIDGLDNYRNICRKDYNLLSSKKEIKDVEYSFSRQLVTYYCLNKEKKNAIKELKNMLKIKPFSKKTILSIIKIIFTKRYFKYIEKL